MNLREAASGLLATVESAINSGDWKVDGACDPTVDIIRLKNILAKPRRRKWVELEDADIQSCPSWCGDQHDFAYEIEAKLKEKNG